MDGRWARFLPDGWPHADPYGDAYPTFLLDESPWQDDVRTMRTQRWTCATYPARGLLGLSPKLWLGTGLLVTLTLIVLNRPTP